MNNSNFFTNAQGNQTNNQPPNSMFGNQMTPNQLLNTGLPGATQPFASSTGILGQPQTNTNYGGIQPITNSSLTQRLNTFNPTPTPTPPSGLFGNSNVSPFNSTPTSNLQPSSGFSNQPISKFNTTPGFDPSSGFGSQSKFQSTPGFGSQSSAPFGLNNSPFTSNFTSSNLGTSNNMIGLGNPMNSLGASTNSTSLFTPSNQFNSGTTTSGSFMAQQTASPWPSNTSLSGNWSMASKGSKPYPYTTTRIKEDTGIFSDLVDITGMNQYSSKAIDEIRIEDYETSRRPPKAPEQSFGSTFGQLSGIKPSFLNNNTSQLNNTTSQLNNTTSQLNNTTSNLFGSLANSSSNLNTNLNSNLNTGFGSGSISQSSPFTNIMSNQNSNLGLQTQPSNTFTSNASQNQLPFSNIANQTPKPSFGTTISSNPFNSGLNTNNFQTSATPTTSSNLFNNSNNTQPQNLSSSLAPQNTSYQTSNLFGSNGLNQQSSLNTSGNIFGNKTLGNDSTIIAPPQVNQTSNMFQQPSMLNNANSSNITQSNPFGMQSSGNLNNNNVSQPLQNSSIFSYNIPTQNSFNQSKVDLADPYLIKNINFEKNPQQKHSFKIPLPVPLFDKRKDTPNVEIKLRSPRPITKSSVYTIPNLNDVDLSRPISNLVIGFEGSGRIEYQEPVSLKSFDDIEKKLMFRNETVECNDPIGTGLNKKARIYVEGLYPVSRTTNEIIKGKVDVFPQKGIQERFIYQLKNDDTKKFVDYDIEKGIYVYEVNHF